MEEMAKLEIKLNGIGTGGLIGFQLIYDGKLLTEELIAKDSPLFKMEVHEVARKLLRGLETLYEHVFSFKDFEDLTLLPTRKTEMETAGEHLRIVRLALSELNKIRVVNV